MKKEIVQRQLEAKTLREDVESTQRECTLEQKEYEKTKDEMERFKVIYSYIDNIIKLIK